MRNNTEKTPLTKEIINELLIELGNMLEENNIQANFYVYGGAVMCVEYELRYYTFDIDCIFSDENVRRYSKILTKKYKLHEDWLNDAILNIVNTDMKKEEFERTVRIGGLNVYVPTIEQMLAMKLFSARMGASKDLEDAYKLARIIGIRNTTQMRNILKTYFKLESIRDRNKKHKNIIGRFMVKLEELLNED